MKNWKKYLKNKNDKADIKVTFTLADNNISDYDLVLQICEHVTKIRENILPVVYIDRWRNVILDEEDYKYFADYEASLEALREKYRPLFEQMVKKLRASY